ncbi:MAG: PAS domain S-box protein [Desulfobacterales bacterium]|nr:PAS domain S-box protein [Desulfobacterales bacterium]
MLKFLKKEIKTKISNKLILTFSFILIISLASMTYIGIHFIEEFGNYLTELNKKTVKDSSQKYLSQILYEKTNRFESSIKKIENYAKLLSEKTLFFIENADIYGQNYNNKNYNFDSYQNSIQYAITDEKVAILYWGDSSVLSKKNLINSLSQLEPYLKSSIYLNAEIISSSIMTESSLCFYYPVTYENIPFSKETIKTGKFYTIASPSENKDKKTVWTDLYKSYGGKGLVTTANSPIYDSNNNFLGVATIGVSFEKTFELSTLNKYKTENDGFYFLINDIGQIIVFPETYLHFFGLNGLNKEDLNIGQNIDINIKNSSIKNVKALAENIINTQTYFGEYKINSQNWYFFSNKISSTKWILGIFLPESAIISDLQKNIQFISAAQGYIAHKFTILIFSFLLVTIILLSLLLVSNFINPLKKLEKAALDVKDGNFDTHIHDYREDEFGVIYKLFNEMIDFIKKGKKLEAEYSSQLKKEVEQKTYEISQQNIKLQNFMDMLKKEISERAEVEENLRESEERYYKIFETSRVIKIVVDPENSSIIDANKAACDYYGYSRENFIKKSVYDIIVHTEEELKNEIMKAQSENRPYYRFVHKIASGEVRDVEVYFGDFKLKEKTYIHSIIIDVTDKNKMQKELIKAKKLEAVASLAGGIAHDFNNLLTIILGNISLGIHLLNDDNPAKKRLKDAENGVMRAGKLTHIFLNLSKGENLVTKPILISEFLENVSMLVFSGSNIKCEYDFPKQDFYVKIDYSQMQEALSNILKNAKESMSDGGIVKISITSMDKSSNIPNKNIKIVITDTGCGIDEGVLLSIFDPYFSTKKMGNTKGLGLGLSIADSIIRNHNGHIDITSKKGKGTTVNIYLPLFEYKTIPDNKIPDNKKSYIAYKKIIEKNVEKGIKNKILVMDDEKMILSTIKHILSQYNYKMEFATRGEEAISLYKKAIESGEPFDAVILDLTIKGGMGGKETFDELQTLYPSIKAIISSGYVDNDIIQNYNKYGFKAVIKKPFDEKLLCDTLKLVLQD